MIGALAGVSSLALPNFIDEILNSRYGRTGGFVLVTPQQRLIVTATDKSRIMEELPVPGIIPLIDRFIQGYEGSGITVNPHGVELLASAKGIPAAGWYVAGLLPIAEAFAPIRDMQQRMLLATLLLTLLAGVLTWWMLRRQLAPLQLTAKKLAAMSDNSQPTQALPIVRQDEIGQVIGSFNRLLETLRQRETALRESEERYRALHDASFGGIAIHDQGIILDCNQGLSDLTGYSNEELVGMDGLRLIAPEWRERVIANIQSGFALPYEAEGLRKDGSRISLGILGKNIPYKGKTVRVTEFRDITERKQAEETLHQRTDVTPTIRRVTRQASR